MDKLLRKNLINSFQYVPGRSKFDLSNDDKQFEKIQLSSNTSILGPSQLVLNAINSTMNKIHYYPDPNAKKLRSKLAKINEININNLLIGNGSAEIIDLINHSFIEPGDEVLISEPTFQKYKISANICNAKLIAVKLNKSKHDLENLLKNISKKTKVIFLDNPNNPVGSIISKDDLQLFLDEVPPNVICVIDEAYHEFNFPENYISYKDYVQKNNVIFLRSFSKAYGIAGLRVGYMIGHAETVNYVNKVREVFNVNLLGLEAAYAALEDIEHLNLNVSITISEKEKYYRVLDSLDFKYYKSMANFILINTERDLDTVDKYLLEKGIIIRPIELSDNEEGHIRVTMGSIKENKYFFDVLAQLKKTIKKTNKSII